MNTPTDESLSPFRRTVYVLLITLGTGAMLGRILAVDSIDRKSLQKHLAEGIPAELQRQRQELVDRGFAPEQIEREMQRKEAALQARARLERPFLSANDRSRWCTLRALVEPKMRVAGAPYAIDKVTAQPNWDTIDMVKHDGHLYSSKPPLFPTLMAAEYWLIYNLTGLSLQSHPYTVGRFILVTVNLLPLVVYFLLLARLAERFGRTDWGRTFVMAAAVFGTFLTTFAVTVNNHLPAAVCSIVAIYAAIRIGFDGRREWRYFVVAGLFAALTAANELPALALLAALGLALFVKAPRQTMSAYLPAALVVAAGFFGTNWIAHRSLRPPYMHRSTTDAADNWYTYEYQRGGRTISSYWQNRVGIDRGEPSPAVHAFNVLLGHHGIFSLTPVWLLSVAGLAVWLVRPDDPRLRHLALLIGAVSLVCLVFYLLRPQDDRNYGGMTAGFRWMFWFAPMWLLAMLPAADAVARRKSTRAVALVLLGLSVMSAAYPTWNPWTHPWLLNYIEYLGWVQV